MYSDLSNLSEIELIKQYRCEPDFKKKSSIFRVILLKKGSGGKTWHENILSHAYKNKLNVNSFDSSLNEDDLYQEIIKAFHKAIEEWFDVNTKYSFSTYAWYVINTAVDRIYQTLNTRKRKTDSIKQNLRWSDSFDEVKVIADVVCDQNFGVYKTLEKNVSMETNFVCRDLIEHLKNSLKVTDDNIQEDLTKELKKSIINKTISDRVITRLANKYSYSEEEVLIFKQKVSSNLEKQMFLDVIRLIELDVKDDSILARKYNCSRSQITKTKQRLAIIFEKKLNKVNLTKKDCLSF